MISDPASGQRHGAYALGLLMICAFVLTLPLYREHVAPVAGFALVVDTALALLAALVAVLLFAQYRRAGGGVLLLACAFLFVGLTTIPQLARGAHGLPFVPGLRFLAELALPVAATGHALLARGPHGARPFSRGAAGIAITIVLAALALWLTAPEAAAAQAHGRATAQTLMLVGACGAALALSWRHRATPLDLWLMVALTAWLIEALLEGMARDGASFPWHVAHVYGLLGVGCMLFVLLAQSVATGPRVALPEPRPFTYGEQSARPESERAVVDDIADELSQPLCAINANVDAIQRLMDRQPPDMAEVRAALADIMRDTQRACETIRLARLAGGELEPAANIDVAQLLDECLGPLRGEMQLRQVTCEVQTAAQLPGIRGVRRQLLHLLENLVTNALEAMAGRHGSQRRLRVHASRHDARAVVICVEDSGAGVAADHATRVFDPFFTTKPYRFGLGLAICRSIVDAHGGHISVGHGSDGGASFRVVLPVGS